MKIAARVLLIAGTSEVVCCVKYLLLQAKSARFMKPYNQEMVRTGTHPVKRGMEDNNKIFLRASSTLLDKQTER